jgi:hypothetical protein
MQPQLPCFCFLVAKSNGLLHTSQEWLGADMGPDFQRGPSHPPQSQQQQQQQQLAPQLEDDVKKGSTLNVAAEPYAPAWSVKPPQDQQQQHDQQQEFNPAELAEAPPPSSPTPSSRHSTPSAGTTPAAPRPLDLLQPNPAWKPPPPPLPTVSHLRGGKKADSSVTAGAKQGDGEAMKHSVGGEGAGAGVSADPQRLERDTVGEGSNADSESAGGPQSEVAVGLPEVGAALSVDLSAKSEARQVDGPAAFDDPAVGGPQGGGEEWKQAGEEASYAAVTKG